MNDKLKTDIEQSAGKHWEEDNRNLDGVNPYAYLLGFKTGANWLHNEGYRFTVDDMREIFKLGADHYDYFEEGVFQELINYDSKRNVRQSYPKEVSDDDAKFIVTACNYHERMKEVIRMVATRTAKVLPDGTPIFSARMASQMAKDILKELEEQK